MEQNQDNVPKWLTDEFLEGALKNAYKDKPVQLISKELIFDTSVGDHYASTMYRVKTTFKLDGRNEDISLIIKTLPNGSPPPVSKAFQTETKILDEVLPKMSAILEPISSNKCVHFGAKYFKTLHGSDDVIVVEDLSPLGYKMAKRQTGLDLDHCLLVMRTLARFHAASLALRKKEPELIISLPEHLHLREDTGKMFDMYAKETLKNLSAVATSWEKGKQYSERLLKCGDTFIEDFQDMLRYDSGCFNVLIHGDMWVNNMLFRYDADGKVTEVKFVDFQLSCYNAAVIDILYFIYTSPTEYVREHHTDSLLREYHSELCDTLRQLGLKNSTFSYEKLLEDYEKKMLHGMYSALMVFPIVAADFEDALGADSGTELGTKENETLRRLKKPHVTRVLQRLVPLFAQKNLF